MQTVHHDLSLELETTFEDAEATIRNALKHEGFGVLTVIDVQKTLKEKIGADIEYYLILGACNPALAYTALQHDRDIGLLLPCNVTVRESDGGVVVSIMDPALMTELSGVQGMETIAAIARDKLERVIDELAE